MPAEITANALMGEKSPAVPYKEDTGDFYKYIMYFDDNRRIAYADDPVDLIEVLYPGYENLDDDERMNKRLKIAMQIQSSAQAQIVASLTAEERETLEDWELKVLQGTYNETRPYAIRDFWKETLPSGVSPEDVDEEEQMSVWSKPHPIVLLDVAYDPWTDIIPPLGNPDGSNIIWISPVDETEFLESLSTTGLIAFGARKHD